MHANFSDHLASSQRQYNGGRCSRRVHTALWYACNFLVFRCICTNSFTYTVTHAFSISESNHKDDESIPNLSSSPPFEQPNFADSVQGMEISTIALEISNLKFSDNSSPYMISYDFQNLWRQMRIPRVQITSHRPT